jgi:ankyrin repeat domain-containing protein 50
LTDTIHRSIVIYYLGNLEERPGSNICVAFVYLRYSEPLSVRDILESLVKQIVERHDDLVDAIAGLYTKHERESTKPSQKDLMVALAEFLTRGKKLFFVLDALDEMRVEDRPVLLRLLASLDAKLFITSRPLDVVQKQYPHAQFFDIAASQVDIALHVQNFLQHSPEVMTLLEGTDLEQNLAKMIHRKSGGM